ncbi:MAG TPA: hypothetical protein PLP21_11850 [Pyrinomonadaceae bacterium]|nr:hypothetical protein [Acidobacteriota bacterium]HQZ97003.1 hypothetical protein [Pyrinomonadaceae bacterium]
MKFQKGLLSDNENGSKSEISRPVVPSEPAAPQNTIGKPPADQSIVVEKDRLFETVKETSNSGRRYVIAIGIFSILVTIAAIGGGYLMRPGVGDRITSPRGLEAALREHFLTKEKRDSTDIAFYQCESFYWARVGVETRNDLPNPVFRIGTYAARATPNGESWDITAVPITGPEMDVPCK